MRKYLCDVISKNEESLWNLCKFIYDHPELGFHEYRSSDAMINLLRQKNFAIEEKVGGLDTAFVASCCPYDRKGLQIDILAEYDALGLGDSFGPAYQAVHACGHNIIAAAAVGAGIALIKTMKRFHISGTVRVVGTPAEEGGGGKIIMQKHGVFDRTDAAMMIHPTSGVSKIAGKCCSTVTLKVCYHGLAAHAGNHKEKGINAQDAANICYMSIGCLRYQLPASTQVFVQFVHCGEARAIIPDLCELNISIRCLDAGDLEETIRKVKNCIQAGALASGCQVEVEGSEKYLGRVRNSVLERIVRKNCELLGEPLMEGMIDDRGGEDFGNLSRVFPGIMFYPSLLPEEKISNHTPRFYELCASPKAKEVLLLGSKVLALSALDLLLAPDLLDLARQELQTRLNNGE